MYIFNDPLFGPPKTIDFHNAISLPKGVNISNLNDTSKTYFSIDSLKKNIIEIHKKEFMNALFSKKVYLVEGINDELFVKKLLVKFDRQYDQYSIFCCYGKPHFLPFIKILQQLNINVVPLFDRDDESKRANMLINLEIKKCQKYMESINYLEEELKYSGKKMDVPNFVDFLNDFDNYEKYSYLIEEGE